MSLYYTQKFLYQLNRDARVRERFNTDLDGLLSEYQLSEEELTALMHYAALHKMEWNDYLESMRNGVREHGPVREGLYTMASDR